MISNNRTTKTKPTRRKSLRKRIRIGSFLILVPIVAAVMTGYYVFGDGLMTAFANRGNDRLTTDGWQSAKAALDSSQPQYGPKFAYYKLQEGQDLAWVASHFSVNLTELQKLNPGTVVWGTTIMVPPVEAPLTPLASSQLTSSGLVVTQSQGNTYVSNKFGTPEAFLTLPQLMQVTQAYNVISQTGPKTFMINKPIYVQDNIRVDITDATVDKLYLRSSPGFDITTLTFQNSEALFKNVTVSSLDPATNKPDSNVTDGRSFLRAYENARMDMINTTSSYLGMTLDQIQDPAIKAKVPFVSQGGVYGVSWRIGTGTFGSNIATGWVENSTFEHNHIGAFTFGASGMMWKSNLFTLNEVYGLDPHDDSNNATIEYNRFVSNGKHGFIVSKRCDYNTIKDNVSIDNALHGFMLHDNSDYNIFENNIAIGNYDNFVMYASNYNTVSNNKSYDPRGSHVRINMTSIENYVSGNAFYGGKKGVYLYGGVTGVDISDNTFYNVINQVTTNGATQVLFDSNQSNGLGYQVPAKDRVVFGVNKINKKPAIDLSPLNIMTQGKLDHKDLPTVAAQLLKQL